MTTPVTLAGAGTAHNPRSTRRAPPQLPGRTSRIFVGALMFLRHRSGVSSGRDESRSSGWAADLESHLSPAPCRCARYRELESGASAGGSYRHWRTDDSAASRNAVAAVGRRLGSAGMPRIGTRRPGLGLCRPLRSLKSFLGQESLRPGLGKRPTSSSVQLHDERAALLLPRYQAAIGACSGCGAGWDSWLSTAFARRSRGPGPTGLSETFVPSVQLNAGPHTSSILQSAPSRRTKQQLA
jgi:hypothetical protein